MSTRNEAKMYNPPPEVKSRVSKQDRETYDEPDAASGVLPAFQLSPDDRA